jgi:hypothetical protein
MRSLKFAMEIEEFYLMSYKVMEPLQSLLMFQSKDNAFSNCRVEE